MGNTDSKDLLNICIRLANEFDLPFAYGQFTGYLMCRNEDKNFKEIRIVVSGNQATFSVYLPREVRGKREVFSLGQWSEMTQFVKENLLTNVL